MHSLSTLYINRVTTVDCAILSQWGRSVGNRHSMEVCGFSFNVDVELSGLVDPIENVVVDFGTLKKFLKAQIDHLEYGYDHKLIIPESLMSSSPDGFDIAENSDGSITINNDGVCILEVPRNAVKVTTTEGLDERLSKSVGFLESMRDLEFDRDGEYAKNDYFGSGEVLRALEVELKHFLQTCVDDQYAGKSITIESVSCDCETTKPKSHLRSEPRAGFSKVISASNYFAYTHGLKDSTSVGCKNIVHGHLSYIQLVAEVPYMCAPTHNQELLQHLCSTIAKDLNGVHFAKQSNITCVGETQTAVEKYNAEGRGSFMAMLYDDSPSRPNYDMELTLFRKVLGLDTESTIENLVSMIFKRYETKLCSLNVKSIYVSEGLHKGSYYHVGEYGN